MADSLTRSSSAPFLDREAGFMRRLRRSKTLKLEPLEGKAQVSTRELPPLKRATTSSLAPPLPARGDRSLTAPAESPTPPQVPAPTLLSRRRSSTGKTLRLGVVESYEDRAPSKQAAGPSSTSSASTRPPSSVANSVGGVAKALPMLARDAAVSVPTTPESQDSPATTGKGDLIIRRKSRRNISIRSSVSALSEAAPTSPRTCRTDRSTRQTSFQVESSQGSAAEAGNGRGMRCDCICYRWKRGQGVGSGSFGTVYKALNLDNGEIFAVKKTALPTEDSEKATWRHELDICEDLRHRHIVTYFGHEIVDDSLYIHMEYLPGGSLSSILKEFGALTSPLLKKATRGMVEGLDYLHTRSPPIVHRDIKSANVLVGEDFCVKLADFGCSKRSDVTASLTMVGSIPWMAPEVINQEGGHGRKADIWSLGCVVIEMVTAEKPWGNGAFDNPFAALKHIGMSEFTPPIPDDIDEGARDLAKWCTKRTKLDRPTSAELLMHDFTRE